MEKRHSRREGAAVPATAFDAPGASWPCVIRNYCGGGLFVEFPPADSVVDDPRHRSRRNGDPLEVRFHDPRSASTSPVRVRTRVAHVGSTGLGLAFVQPEQAVCQALRGIHSHRASPAAGDPDAADPGPARRRELLDRAGRMIAEALELRFPDFVAGAESRLLDAAERAVTAELRQEHFRAARVLQSSGGEILARWLRSLNRAWDGLRQAEARRTSPAPQQQRQRRSDLELVDKESFDQWVVFAGLVSKAEAQLYTSLYELEQRLSYLARRPVSKESNPVGPGALVWGFKEAIEPLELHVDSQRALLRSLDREVISALASTYESVNGHLRSEGILPRVDRPAVGPATTARTGTGPTAPEHRRSTPSAPNRVLTTLKRVLAPASFRGAASGQARVRPEASAQGAPVYEYETDEVIDALSEIQLVKNLPLAEQVQAALDRSHPRSGHPMALSEGVTGAIRAAESLVDSFRDDARMAALVKEAVQRLEVPLVKAAVEQPEFLNDPEHPAVQTIKALDKLAVSLTGEPPAAQAASEVGGLIREVASSLGRDRRPSAQAFADARDALQPYVTEYERLFETNVRRVVESCQGQERLEEARRAVAEALGATIGGRSVARTVNELVRLGWGQLLVLTWLDDGPESGRWKSHLGAVETVDALLPAVPAMESPDPARIAGVMETLEQGLAQAPVRPAEQRILLRTLGDALEGDGEALERLCRDREPAVADPFGLAADDDLGEQGVEPRERDALAPWLETIRRLATGDWMVERLDGSLSRAISLAWTNATRTRFAFVDGRGFKAMQCGPVGLARALERGRLSVLEDGRLPLVERAVERVLKDTYDRMAFDSAHDPLTGLINRRAFEARVAQVLERARSDDSRHALLMLDVDRFKLVNDMSGHEGGDRLLKEVSHILKTYLQEGSTLARTGDDEFGILVEDCPAEFGFRIAETQRRAVENLDFRWEGRHFPVSVSVGMVAVDGAAPSVSQLLREVDSACFLAKEAGRNTTKVFEASDQDVRVHQGAMKAVPLVEQAIQEGRLKLHVQMIEPVFLAEGLKEHYEILLRILDEGGNPLPPGEFIQAVERFDRMRSLDRWVIEHVFAWLGRHVEELGEVGGFSINLSGQSLGDPSMLRLLLEQLQTTPYPRDRLAFEITETAMVRNMASAREFVERIKALGCSLYLDDFGSGMSSYSYLKDFPVDCIKIDGAFIRNIAKDEKDLALVRSITEIAHFSERKVIAEYVEDEATLVKLRELEVDFVQGYAVGRPFPLENLIARR